MVQYNRKKNKDTLRVSAIAFISALPIVNILTILFLIGILIRHTPIDKFVAAGFVCVMLVFNFFYINSQKSDILRNEYSLFSLEKRKRIIFFFYCYIILSLVLFLAILGYTVYYKKVYGNYDL